MNWPWHSGDREILSHRQSSRGKQPGSWPSYRADTRKSSKGSLPVWGVLGKSVEGKEPQLAESWRHDRLVEPHVPWNNFDEDKTQCSEQQAERRAAIARTLLPILVIKQSEKFPQVLEEGKLIAQSRLVAFWWCCCCFSLIFSFSFATAELPKAHKLPGDSPAGLG